MKMLDRLRQEFGKAVDRPVRDYVGALPAAGGCVKTCAREERAALFSLLSFLHSGRQCFYF
jgi:hypothetical protein